MDLELSIFENTMTEEERKLIPDANFHSPKIIKLFGATYRVYYLDFYPDHSRKKNHKYTIKAKKISELS